MRATRWLGCVVLATLVYPALTAAPARATDGYFWFTMRPQYPIPETDARTQLAMGVRYDKGHGVPQNFGLAFAYYRAAAEKGMPEAQYNVGRMYLEGKHVARDLVVAHMWLNLALASYPHGAVEKRRQATLARAVIEKRMTVEQITEAQLLAVSWRPR
jgi:TPR repeat protein